MKTISKIKSILLLATITIFVAGCNKGKDPAPIVCYLTKSTFTYTSSFGAGSTENNTFTYSSDMKLTTVVSAYTFNGATKTETYTVSYDTKGNISKTQNSSTPVSRTEYTYDANSRLTREDFYEDMLAPLAVQVDAGRAVKHNISQANGDDLRHPRASVVEHVQQQMVALAGPT